jgi:hypothetical protein
MAADATTTNSTSPTAKVLYQKDFTNSSYLALEYRGKLIINYFPKKIVEKIFGSKETEFKKLIVTPELDEVLFNTAPVAEAHLAHKVIGTLKNL